MILLNKKQNSDKFR